MLQSIPIYFYIPAIVFVLVVLLAFLFLMLSDRKSTPSKEELSMVYRIPENYGAMLAREKRLVTIRNLYLNHGRDPESIAGLLEMDKALINEVLLKSGHLR